MYVHDGPIVSAHLGGYRVPRGDSVRQTRLPLGDLASWTGSTSGGAGGDLFRPALLRDPTVTFIGGYDGRAIVAGAVLNRTEDVIGISNVFTTRGDLDSTWRGCLVYVDCAAPGAGIVGYESGDELAAAHRQGSESVAPLRIWLRR